ncbi:MAG TPA: M1 family aminopeptidase [Polyangia bacterium]|jgi:aminopeptidase N|nr:M1 family aminopeptidase [Polyangia bacterium]
MANPFAPPGTPHNFTADRSLRVVHARLELDLDLAGKRLAGAATLTLASRVDELRVFVLDAVEMEIESVALDGQPAAFDYDGERLRVTCARPFARDVEFRAEIRYRCNPRRGLYFMGPDDGHPDRPLQCWTQGQDDDSRHYWPCIDHPIEKFTTEVICTAPAGNFVLSNGDLLERKELPAEGGREARVRWHYHLDFPQPAYLVTVVCGPFAEIVEQAPKTGVDVYYYSAPGRQADARRSFARTPAMIDFFSERIGVPYPHKRYSQIAVPDFIFGGMENTSATTLTELSLVDERAALDHDVDGLVSHELAHQWWGDLVTCREWSEGWLNEGFATYFEYVWREHAKGRDEADWEQLSDTEGYLAEAGRYQRAVVCRQYAEPIHLFDAHLYDKGGRVLHMLRHSLGDDLFWRALRHYVGKHARGSVETRDLARAIEEVSGRSFDEFLDRWIARPGHPELEGAWEWDEDRKVGTLRIAQKQAVTAEAPLFKFETLVRFEVEGQERDEPVAISEATHAFEFRLPARPAQVVFDPGDVILKTIKMEKPRALWRRQLEASRLGVDRALAATALGGLVEPASVEALAAAIRRDGFWAVRVAATRALGRMRRDDAREVLLAAFDDAHPKVRRAAAAALGEWRGDERAGRALAARLQKGDASVFVEAEAALALGRTRSPHALDILPTLFGRPSFQDILRSRAVEGLGFSGDERALAVIKSAWRPHGAGVFLARRAVVTATAELCAGTSFARAGRELLEDCLLDPDFRVRGEAAAALGRMGMPEAIPAIERTLAAELDGRARRRMGDAIRALRDGSRPAEQVTKLRDELDRLRGEQARLRERLEKLEAKASGAMPPTPPKAPPAKPKRPRPVVRRRGGQRPVRR